MANSNEGFLTEGHRELLKIATENAENLSSSPKSPTSLLSDPIKVSTGAKAPTVGFASRHVRRTHSGKLGRAKKEGGGGKGTWRKLLDTDGESHLDRNDSNYDSGEEPYQLVGSAISDPLDDYKKVVAGLIGILAALVMYKWQSPTSKTLAQVNITHTSLRDWYPWPWTDTIRRMRWLQFCCQLSTQM